MAPKAPSDPELLPFYRPPSGWGSALFWSGFALETITFRRLSTLVGLRLHREAFPLVEGGENLPQSGSFIIAANHYHGRDTLDALAAIIRATGVYNLEAARRFMVVSGRKERVKPGKRPLPARLVKKITLFAYSRWRQHIIRIPLGNGRVSIKTLREWRERARQQPAIVFPEGKARLQFGRARPGAGRWLASLGVPVIPVGVWWHAGVWHVQFGPPLEWSHRAELRDLQVGLNIAKLLPPELAPAWSADLAIWREAHESALSRRG